MRGLVAGIGLLLLSPALATAQPTAQSGQAAGEIARLHERLRLNSNQEAAWRDYQAAVAANPQADDRRRAAEMLMPTLPTPRRVALMESTLAADLADLRRVGDAVIAFYNQLAPGQQQTFDRETLPAATGRTR